MRFGFAIALVLAMAGLLSSPAFAQESVYPQVQTKVNPTSGTVGEHFQLNVTATVPDPRGLQVLPLFDTQTSWTALGDPEVTDRRAGNELSRTYSYTIVPFETGQVALPQVAVTYSPGGGVTSTTVLSEADWVEINSVLSGNGSASALRDVKPPVALPLPPAVVWSGALVLFAIVALLAYMVWRRYSSRLRGMLGRTLTPPELALKEIHALEEERLVEQKKIKELYTRLSDAVRHYLESAFGIPAAEYTSNELLRAMDELVEEQPPEQINNYRHAMARLVELLDESDLVKFARLMPDPPRCRKALEAGREVVNLTRYKFEPAEEVSMQPERNDTTVPPAPPQSSVHAGVSK